MVSKANKVVNQSNNVVSQGNKMLSQSLICNIVVNRAINWESGLVAVQYLFPLAYILYIETILTNLKKNIKYFLCFFLANYYRSWIYCFVLVILIQGFINQTVFLQLFKLDSLLQIEN